MTTTSNASMKSTPKLSIPTKVETNQNNAVDLKHEDESLFTANITNIIQGEQSYNPSPLLMQHILDLLQVMPDSPTKIPAAEHDGTLLQSMQGVRLFQFTKQVKFF